MSFHASPQATSASEILLHVSHIVKAFSVGKRLVPVLNGVSLKVSEGEVVAIMGPSGSGKSTLLNCIGGLEPVDSGSVTAAGVQMTRLSAKNRARARRKTVGFIFQSYNLVPYLSVADNLTVTQRLSGITPDLNRADALLKELGIDHLKRLRPATLSGGEQQRVAIARALLTDPYLLLADEPTGALDSASWNTVLEALKAQCKRPGHAGIIVTHDPTVAGSCDRVVLLRDGRTRAEITEPTTQSVTQALAQLENEAESSPRGDRSYDTTSHNHAVPPTDTAVEQGR